MADCTSWFFKLYLIFASALIIALAERQLLRHEGRPAEPAVQWRNMVRAGIGNINIGVLHNYCVILVESMIWRDRNLKFGPQIMIWRWIILAKKLKFIYIQIIIWAKYCSRVL